MTLLVVTAVPAEAAAALAGFRAEPVRIGRYAGVRAETGAGEVLAIAGGVGPARSAACTAFLLSAPTAGGAAAPAAAHSAPPTDGVAAPGASPPAIRPAPAAAPSTSLATPAAGVIVAGIGGGFAGRAGIGDIVVADLIIHADLGADSPDGFLPLSTLGFGAESATPPAHWVATAVHRTGGIAGPIVTVSTATGTAAGAGTLARRLDPAAEGMEGAGGWVAAEAAGVPFLEIRAISNLVGPRDRASWEIPRALTALGQAMSRLLAEPLP